MADSTGYLKHLPNVELCLYYPQVFLCLDFHDMDDVSKRKSDVLGLERAHLHMHHICLLVAAAFRLPHGSCGP